MTDEHRIENLSTLPVPTRLDIFHCLDRGEVLEAKHLRDLRFCPFCGDYLERGAGE